MKKVRKELNLPPPWDQIFPLVTRVTIWGLLGAAIYILRSFFLLVFLTFVFAYIQSNSVNRLEGITKNRTLRATTVFIMLLAALSTVGIFVLPKVQRQTETFAKQFFVYVGKVDETLLQIGKKYPLIFKIMPELNDIRNEDEAENNIEKGKRDEPARSPSLAFLQNLAGFEEDVDGALQIDQALKILRGIGGRFAAILSAFLLSLLLSFLIVLDLPSLSNSVQSLKNTRLRFLYDEVAENIYEFTHVLGQALEAQLYIALANTFLTTIGLYILGMGTSVAFLSVIVFFCSFIPVAGIFISSLPICLIAFQSPDGLKTMFFAIIMIAVIHLIEGYILNPRIYGYRMKINPVVVLIILTISGKLFHFWGLILGVPVFTYFFSHAIRYKTARP
jgi:predicted PurR-regulated permease PerM